MRKECQKKELSRKCLRLSRTETHPLENQEKYGWTIFENDLEKKMVLERWEK